MKTKETQLPPKYEKYLDYFYLRDFDLRPEQVRDCPYHFLSEEFIKELISDNLLFKTEDEALRARHVMVQTYKVYKIKNQ